MSKNFWYIFRIIDKQKNMKKVGLVTWMVILAAVVSAFSVLTIEADDVRGTYWNSEKTAHIRIYRAKDGLYYGKIDKLVEPNNADGTPKKDAENPDESLKSRDRLGMLIMRDSNGMRTRPSGKMVLYTILIMARPMTGTCTIQGKIRMS